MGEEFLGILLLLVSIYLSFCAYFVGAGFPKAGKNGVDGLDGSD
jgi:hypothetical protein